MNEIITAPELPYRVRAEIFTDVEREFLSILVEQASGHYFIIPKLALSDLFRVNKPNENIQYVSKMGGKSIDFVLFSRDTFTPVAAIELDNQKQSEHAIGSKLIDEISDSVGFPVFHFIESENYEGIDWSGLFSAIESNQGKADRSNFEPEFSPICPSCGITMVLRFDQDGPITGEKYYGCLNYPDCIEKISVEV